MQKTDLIDQMAMAADISRAKATLAMDAFLKAVTRDLQKGNTVGIVGFGRFAVVQRAARKVRNPQTGVMVDVPAKKAVKFTVGAQLKKSVQ